MCFTQLCKTWSLSSCCCLFSRLAFPYPASVNYCSTWIRPSPMIHKHLSRTSWTSVSTDILLLKHFNMLRAVVLNSSQLISFCIYPATDYMAHLVEVQHERGATGGHTFHALLSSSIPPHIGQCHYSSNNYVQSKVMLRAAFCILLICFIKCLNFSCYSSIYYNIVNVFNHKHCLY